MGKLEVIGLATGGVVHGAHYVEVPAVSTSGSANLEPVLP